MITLSDVRKIYRTRNGEVTALDGINLHIPQGQIHGIVGESGARKSTLIRCLTALETPPVERFRSTVKISPRSTSANASKLAVISAWFSSM